MIFRPDTPEIGEELLDQAKIWLGDYYVDAKAFDLGNQLWVGGMPIEWFHVRDALFNHGFSEAGQTKLMWGFPLKTDSFPEVQEDGLDSRVVQDKDTRTFEVWNSAERVGVLTVVPMKGSSTPIQENGWWIEWVEVKEKYRGMGIGKKLFCDLLNWIQHQLDPVLVGNTPAPQAMALNQRVGMTQHINLVSFARNC